MRVNGNEVIKLINKAYSFKELNLGYRLSLFIPTFASMSSKQNMFLYFRNTYFFIEINSIHTLLCNDNYLNTP